MGQPMNSTRRLDCSLPRQGEGRDVHAAAREAPALVSPARTYDAIAERVRQAIQRSAKVAAVVSAVADIDREDLLHGTR